MKTEQQEAEIRAKIAALRQSYARLAAICGVQTISRETIADYAKQLQTLEAQLN